MPPQTMRQFLKPPDKTPDTPPRTQSTMSLLDYFSTVIQGLADPTGWTEPKAEDFDNPHAYTQALKAHGVGQLLGMAVPLAAPAAVMLRNARTTEEAVPAAAQTLKAFHGSPHDFPAERLIQLPGGQQAYQLASEALPQGASVVKELPLGRFRGDKIGTGEGGQAYSYGHYSAQNENVSTTYRQMGGDAIHFPDGRQQQFNLDTAEGAAQNALNGFSASDRDSSATYAAARKYLRDLVDRGYGKNTGAYDRNVKALDVLSDWQKQGATHGPAGRMYELNLHTSPESLLDWDKPLSQQPQKVIDWLRQSDAPFGYKAKSKNWRGQGALPDDVWLKSLENTTGEELYRALVTPIGRAGHTEGIASQQLADAGIHGVQYLDQGSRTRTTRWQAIHPQGGVNDFPDEASARAFVSKYPEHSLQGPEPGTKNYVIFPHFEHLIEISKKYGISLPAAASLYKWQQSQKGVE